MKPAFKLVESAYRIEKNIPVKRIARGVIIYPFADMLKGDSFLVPAADQKAYRCASNSLHRQARMFNKQFAQGYEFTVRKVPGGVRCWRTK